VRAIEDVQQTQKMRDKVVRAVSKARARIGHECSTIRFEQISTNVFRHVHERLLVALDSELQQRDPLALTELQVGFAVVLWT
jgi:hypothetical protein